VKAAPEEVVASCVASPLKLSGVRAGVRLRVRVRVRVRVRIRDRVSLA